MVQSSKLIMSSSPHLSAFWSKIMKLFSLQISRKERSKQFKPWALAPWVKYSLSSRSPFGRQKSTIGRDFLSFGLALISKVWEEVTENGESEYFVWLLYFPWSCFSGWSTFDRSLESTRFPTPLKLSWLDKRWVNLRILTTKRSSTIACGC